MQPQYVRLIVSPNNNYPSNTLPRSTIQVKSTTPSIGYPASFSSIQILNGISTPTANKLPTRLILTSPPATCGISNGLGKQMKTSPTLQASSLATTPSPLYPVKSPLHKATFTPTLTSTDGSTECLNTDGITLNQDRTSTTPIQKKRQSILSGQSSGVRKKTFQKSKIGETNPHLNKRGKNWTEAETITFIEVWTEFYPRLNSGGSRHTPIYQCMAKQINDVLPGRSLDGSEVKSKVGNLLTEYRRKKKQQSKTGACPTLWPYFDLLDKLLGQRPYNDDNLLSDSMQMEELLCQKDANVTTPVLIQTQTSEEVTDRSSITIDPEETNGRDSNSVITSPSTILGNSTVKSEQCEKTSGKGVKSVPKRKKRVSELKMDLIQELLGKIEHSNDLACKSETKVLELLEKQTRLQEESMSNEREFLQVFKMMANNAPSR